MKFSTIVRTPRRYEVTPAGIAYRHPRRWVSRRMKHKTDPSIFLVRYGLGKYESTAWNLPKVCIPKTETTLVSNFDKDKFLELGYFHSNFRWQGMVFKTQNTDAGSPFMSMESLRLKLHSTKWVDKTKIIIIMTIIENKILWSVSYFSHIVIPYSSLHVHVQCVHVHV